jgi:hypothetical protein
VVDSSNTKRPLFLKCIAVTTRRPVGSWPWLPWLVIMIGLGGCGGGAPEPIQPSQRQTLIEQPPLDTGATPVAQSPAPAPIKPEEMKKEEQGPPPQATPTPEPAKQTPRPTNLADWKKEDFLSAQREGDPKLAVAMMQFAARNVGQPAAAALFRDMLKAVSPTTTPGEGVAPGQAARPPLTPAIVAMLAANNTEEAWQVLRDLVTGDLKTDDEVTATTAALQAMSRTSSEKNDAFLLRVLTERINRAPGSAAPPPTQHVPAGIKSDEMKAHQADAVPIPMDMGATELQRQAQQILDQMGSESFRVKLSTYLLGLNGGDPRIQQFCPIIERARPDNVAAQLVMYRDRKPPEQLKSQFEQYFTNYSSMALGYVLGVLAKKPPVPAAPGSTPPGPVAWGAAPTASGGAVVGTIHKKEEEEGYRGSMAVGLDPSDAANDPVLLFGAARQLWEPKTAEVIGNRVAQIATLKETSQIFALARTMPVDRVRARLFTVLKAKFDDGPNSLFSIKASSSEDSEAKARSMGNMSSTATFDPGFLVVVKMLPREARGVRAKPARPAPHVGEERARSAAGSSAQDGEAVEPQWMAASESLLRELCVQCQTAAATGAVAATGGAMPIEPHAGAKIVSRYDIKLPENAPAELAGIQMDPLEVHYVRIEEMAQPLKLLAYYRRATREKHREIGSNQGAWFDTVTAGAAPGMKRSIDVLITRGPAAEVPHEEEEGTPGRTVKKTVDEPLVIEILTVEIKDPTAESAGKEAEAAKNTKKK